MGLINTDTFRFSLKGSTAKPRKLRSHLRNKAFLLKNNTRKTVVEKCAPVYRQLFNVDPNYYFRLSLQDSRKFKVEWISEGFTRLLGFELEEVNSTEDWHKFIHPGHVTDLVDFFEQIIAVKKAKSKVVKAIPKTGEPVYWLEVAGFPVLDPSNKEAVAIEGAVLDITERKNAEEALRESERRFRLLAEYSPDIIIQFDTSCRIMYTNPAVERMTGIKTFQLTGNTLKQLDMSFGFVKKWEKSLNTVLATGEKVSLEFDHELCDGMGYFNSLFVPEKAEDGTVVSVIAVTHDDTDMKRAEMERIRLIEELQESLARATKLRGLLPICSSCKKIRDDDGYWHQVEEYMQKNWEFDFSHGLCPDCVQTLYPDFFEGNKKGK